MGQNIGTCITAMLSSIGTNKNAKRAAVVHLSFNVIGTMVWLSVFCVVKYIFSPALLDQSASLVGIAVAHSAFNILCTALLLPMSGVLEAVAKKIIPDAKTSEKDVELDERLLDTPPLALESCRRVTAEMGELSVSAMKESIKILTLYTDKLAEDIREKEEKTDRYEDMLGTYLVKLSSNRVSDADSAEVTELLKMIGDFERISDHAVNVLESAEELRQKGLSFSEAAMDELRSLTGAVGEILDLSMDAFVRSDLEAAAKVEPLEQVVDDLKESMRTRHMIRLQRGECSIDAGFVWSDLLTDLERVADHCSNIAGCVLDAARNNVGLHEALREFRVDNQEFMDQYDRFAGRYALSDMNDQITI